MHLRKKYFRYITLLLLCRKIMSVPIFLYWPWRPPMPKALFWVLLRVVLFRIPTMRRVWALLAIHSVVGAEGGGAWPPPDFGRSNNPPISTRWQIMINILVIAPHTTRFLELPTALLQTCFKLQQKGLSFNSSSVLKATQSLSCRM